MTEIRHVELSDLPGWVRTRQTAFLMDRALAEGELGFWRTLLEPARAYGGWDGEECVSTLRTFATLLTVPGTDRTSTVAADALTNVTVASTHRRQGLLTGMLGRSLTDAKERGEVVSVLRAAEWPIYGRFGYWPATWIADYSIRRDRAATVAGGDARSLHAVEPDAAAAVGAPLYDRMGEHNVGQISRSRSRWQRRLGLDGAPRATAREAACVVAVDPAGDVDGLLIWTSDAQDEHEDAHLTVHDLICASQPAYRALCSYLLHMDLVSSIRFVERAVDEVLPWLLGDGRLVRQTRLEDDVWLRILDAPAALAARRYAVEDRLVLDVVDDDFGGFAHGRVELDGGPAHAGCERSSRSPDLTLSQRALAALYLGGNSVASQVSAGLVDEHTPGALTRLAAMLRADRLPWNPTSF